jgi:hypothetical protein
MKDPCIYVILSIAKDLCVVRFFVSAFLRMTKNGKTLDKNIGM